jgi:hypothetical protein
VSCSRVNLILLPSFNASLCLNICGLTFSCHRFLEAEGQRTGFGTCSCGVKNTTLSFAVVFAGCSETVRCLWPTIDVFQLNILSTEMQCYVVHVK